MQIPKDDAELAKFLRFVVDVCTASQRERRQLYERRRRYYLYGQNTDASVRHKRLKSHIGLVTSFLFAPDGIAYSVSAPSNAPDSTVKQFLALEDEWNEEMRDCGLPDLYSETLLWATVFDTMIIKLGWNDHTDQLFGDLIEPSSFGVFAEEKMDFEAQQAMTHSFLLDYDEAVERLVRAGKAADIARLQVGGGEQEGIGLPGTLGQLIITATGGTNITGNISGEIDTDYEVSPSFTPRTDRPLVRFHEVWVWDTEAVDWRIFHMAEPDVILSDSKKTIEALRRAAEKAKPKFDSATNLFLPKETPFVPVTPYPLYNYFWGDSHIEDLIPLQQWSNERLQEIDEILQRQADPAKVFSGFMGLQDEKAEALGGPGTWVADQMPGAVVNELAPKMPTDLFVEYHEIGSLMQEASGLTESIAGKGEKGVRGQGHARQLQITGGGRIRKTAVGLEKSLVRMGDIGLKLKMHNDDEPLKLEDGSQFVASQLSPKYTMRVAGHSHSPLFTQETHEIAGALLKARAADAEQYIRMLNPPRKEALIHALRARQKAEAQARAAQPPQPQKNGRSHHA